MTTEELAKPRWKSIADYPGNLFKVGFIFSLPHPEVDPGFEEHYNKYPNLFKKLDWWEERKVKDLPQFVNLKKEYMDNAPGIYKVEKYGINDDIMGGKILVWINHNGLPMGHSKLFLEPATEQEYEEYQIKRQCSTH